MIERKVIKYSKNLFDYFDYGFKFFENGNVTILSTDFGVQLQYLLNKLSDYPTEKISKMLKVQQDDEKGFFIDKNYSIDALKDFEEEYILWQFTYFTTIALDMLGEKPKYSFAFLNDLRNNKSLEIWLNKQDFKNFWYTSNKIMFLFYFLIYEQERLNINNRDLINYLFDFLDLKQDSNTGFWGTQYGASLENGMFGASHIYLYYDYCNRKIKYKDKIIDNVLKLQNIHGLFNSKFGGACEDYDAIEILCTLSKYFDYKNEVVNKSITKTYNVIKKNQNRDGGFSYSIDNRKIVQKFKDRFKQKEYFYKYSGWEMMRSKCFKSDLWGTYFRIITIAKIEKMLKKGNNYQFYSLPGWGYY